jgi:guanylate kinase
VPKRGSADLGVLLVIAGPSGVGKGTVVRALLEREPSLWLSVSLTTRPARDGERDGVQYRFVTQDEFDRLRRAGQLLESFEVFGHSYGTPRQPVEEHLRRGDDVVLEIDVQGALAVRAAYPDACLVFLTPPSPTVLRQRLVQRGLDDPAEIERRLAAAAHEEAFADRFDAVVVNDDVGTAVAEVAGILDARRASS